MADNDPPATIPIARKKGAATEFAGHLPDERQFLGLVVPGDDGWMPVVLFFAAGGDFVECEHDGAVPGNGDGPPEAALEALDRMLRRLEPYRKDGITVSCFETKIGGREIALRPDAGEGTLRLEPLGLVFAPPWEGDYRQ